MNKVMLTGKGKIFRPQWSGIELRPRYIHAKCAVSNDMVEQ